MSLKFTSLNVKGLNGLHKRSMLWRETFKSKEDVLCIQETHLHYSGHPSISHYKFPHIFLAKFHKKKCGVLIAVRDTVTFTLHSVTADPGGNFLLLEANFNNRPFTVINLYAPNTHQRPFLSNLLKKLPSSSFRGLIICGDFNTVVYPHLNSSNPKRRCSSAHAKHHQTHVLYDTWRCLHDSEKYYSFSQNTTSLLPHWPVLNWQSHSLKSLFKVTSPDCGHKSYHLVRPCSCIPHITIILPWDPVFTMAPQYQTPLRCRLHFSNRICTDRILLP